MGKKVSVIVPVYNACQYLERCVKSLLAQTWQDVEILLIDDGSTDGSDKICDSYADTYEQVRVIHTANGGVSAARNLGIEKCTGEYLTFVDADDILEKNVVTHLMDTLIRTDCDVAGCDYLEFHGDEDAQRQISTGEEGVELQKQEVELLTGLSFIEKGILQSDTRCWSKLYRKESIGEVRFERGLTIGEDMLFLLQLAKRGLRFGRTAYKGYGYFINQDGAMMQNFKDSYMDQITCWKKALDIIRIHAPELTGRAESIVLISTMLTVGKLSMLPGSERKKRKAYAEQCSKLVRQYAGHKETIKELDKGYKIKVAVYKRMPGLYLMIYGRLYRLIRRHS